jgi:hypothetical protein
MSWWSYFRMRFTYLWCRCYFNRLREISVSFRRRLPLLWLWLCFLLCMLIFGCCVCYRNELWYYYKRIASCFIWILPWSLKYVWHNITTAFKRMTTSLAYAFFVYIRNRVTVDKLDLVAWSVYGRVRTGSVKIVERWRSLLTYADWRPLRACAFDLLYMQHYYRQYLCFVVSVLQQPCIYSLICADMHKFILID